MKYHELCKVKHKSRPWLYDVAMLFELNPFALSVGLFVWFLLVSEQVDMSNFFKLSGFLYIEG